jgi:hypothetical protein
LNRNPIPLSRKIYTINSPSTPSTWAVTKRVELATIRLKADTNLVAYLRRRLKLYALFGLPPPSDVCE